MQCFSGTLQPHLGEKTYQPMEPPFFLFPQDSGLINWALLKFLNFGGFKEIPETSEKASAR